MALRNEDGKEFTLAQALAITTGRFFGEKGMFGTVYEVLEYVSGDSNLYTHAIPRFVEECRPYVLQWYPELDLEDEFDKTLTQDNWREVLTDCEKRFGKTLILWTIPMDDHDVIDPVEEAQAMMGDDSEVIIVDISEDDEISPYGDIS